jgi:hypothetical protein
MALDPYAPVRYKRTACFPSGFGNVLADAMAREEDIQVYGEIISQQLFGSWVNLRFDEIPDASGISSTFEKCRNYLTQKIPGYGMERVLYTLNRECVCMSPILKDYFVHSPGALLLALEKMARRGDRTSSMLDRHMIAFVSVREPKMIDPYLGHITSADPGNQAIGLARCLAAIQKRFNTGPVPGITAWLAAMSIAAVDRFNDHDLRADLKKRLDRVKDSGSVAALLDLLDDSRVVQEDTQRFNMARGEFRALVAERARIEGHLKKKRSFGYATGRQVSMVISTVLSAVAITGYLLFYFSGSFR